MMFWFEGGKPRAVKTGVSGLPLLTHAVSRTNVTISLIYGSSLLSGEVACGAEQTTLERGRICANLLVSYLPVTLPFVHPSFEKAGSEFWSWLKGISKAPWHRSLRRAHRMELSCWEPDPIKMPLPHWAHSKSPRRCGGALFSLCLSRATCVSGAIGFALTKMKVWHLWKHKGIGNFN